MSGIRRLFALFLLATPLALAGPAAAQEQPSGTVEFESTSVSLGIGTQSGRGVLTLNDGRKFPFTVKGLKIGDIGIATFKATGVVYRLADLNWFPGYYTAGEGGAVIGGKAAHAVSRSRSIAS